MTAGHLETELARTICPHAASCRQAEPKIVAWVRRLQCRRAASTSRCWRRSVSLSRLTCSDLRFGAWLGHERANFSPQNQRQGSSRPLLKLHLSHSRWEWKILVHLLLLFMIVLRILRSQVKETIEPQRKKVGAMSDTAPARGLRKGRVLSQNKSITVK